MLADLVPLVAQGLFVLSAAPYIARIVRSRASDQHSLACYAMLLLGHAMMVGWSISIASHVGLALSYGLALAVTLAEIGIIAYYRRPRERAAPRPLIASASARTR